MKKLYLVRTIILAGSLLLQLNTLCLHSRGAAGDVDLSFDPGSGVNGYVNTVVVQPDGKVIIGGLFTTVKGLLRTNLARLNADGSGDATFNPVRAYNPVYALAVQSDGKVLAGGQFLETDCGDWGCSYPAVVIRLNANGSLDNSFNPATAQNDSEYGVRRLVGALLRRGFSPRCWRQVASEESGDESPHSKSNRPLANLLKHLPVALAVRVNNCDAVLAEARRANVRSSSDKPGTTT